MNIKHEPVKNCTTCRYRHIYHGDAPCSVCADNSRRSKLLSHWEATAAIKAELAETKAADTKSCETCRFDISICGYSTHIPGCGWEVMSHD